MKSGAQCEHCGCRNNLLLCSRCKSVYYCGKEHQIKDWINHKKSCPAQVLVSNYSDPPNNSKLAVSSHNIPSSPCKLISESVSVRSQSKENYHSVSAMKTGIDIKQAVPIDFDLNVIPLEHSNSIIANGRLPSYDFYNFHPSDNPMESLNYEDLAEVSISSPRFFHHTERDDQGIFDEVCRNVIKDMDCYGVCVVDNFLGKERGMEVLEDVRNLHKKGIFEDGQLVSSKGNKDLKTIRSDQIAWIDGKEPSCRNIDLLISKVDKIILKANKMSENGKMGAFEINGRTKAMVACYPGDGAHYVKHVDNPNKDGRCITSIYYLNPDWDTQKDGGLLRIFPEGWHDQVADIEPVFDRILFFWSDRRNPHEVQPSFKTRYAITLWYFDAAEREQACKRYNAKNNTRH